MEIVKNSEWVVTGGEEVPFLSHEILSQINFRLESRVSVCNYGAETRRDADKLRDVVVVVYSYSQELWQAPTLHIVLFFLAVLLLSCTAHT